jgi:hypothetical protein
VLHGCGSEISKLNFHGSLADEIDRRNSQAYISQMKTALRNFLRRAVVIQTMKNLSSCANYLIAHASTHVYEESELAALRDRISSELRVPDLRPSDCSKLILFPDLTIGTIDCHRFAAVIPAFLSS